MVGWLVGFLLRYGTTLIMYEDRHLGFSFSWSKTRLFLVWIF